MRADHLGNGPPKRQPRKYSTARHGVCGSRLIGYLLLKPRQFRSPGSSRGELMEEVHFGEWDGSLTSISRSLYRSAKMFRKIRTKSMFPRQLPNQLEISPAHLGFVNGLILRSEYFHMHALNASQPHQQIWTPQEQLNSKLEATLSFIGQICPALFSNRHFPSHSLSRAFETEDQRHRVSATPLLSIAVLGIAASPTRAPQLQCSAHFPPNNPDPKDSPLHSELIDAFERLSRRDADCATPASKVRSDSARSRPP